MFKKSTAEKIPIEKIEFLREKSFFGRKSFSIVLKDGKKRDLNEVKTQAAFTELKSLLEKNGIGIEI